MLTSIGVGGFKSLRKVNIDLGQVTVLIGLNGTGKSSVIQALVVLKQSLRRNQLITSGPTIDLGDFNDVVSFGRKGISFSISGSTLFDGRPFAEPKSRASYQYEFTSGQDGVVSSDAFVDIGQFHFDGSWKESRSVVSKEISIAEGNITLSYHPNDTIGMPMRRIGSRASPGYEEEHDEAARTLTRVFGVIESEIRSIFVVPPSRGLDKPQYPLEGGPHQDILDSKGTSQQSSHLASTIAYTSEIEEMISQHIYRITGLKVRHKLVPDRQVSIRTRRDINIVNEGFGTNQLVHLFAQVESSPLGSLVAIEEPEIHLHPKAQAEIAEVLLEIAKKEDKHFLISTHSEHFLFRLLTNVASGKIDPEDLSVYFFELERGFTKATKLEIDKEGRLSGGLKGFFETDLEEFGRFLGAQKT